MRSDKALLEIGGLSLLCRATQVLQLVTNRPVVVSSSPAHRLAGIQTVPDDFPAWGPLGGIATALRVSDTPWTLVIACDLPYLHKAWLDFLTARALKSRADAVVPMGHKGPEPLCAVYHKNAQQRILAAVQGGVHKVTESFDRLSVEYLEPNEWKAFACEGFLFKNMNSPADYQEAKARLESREKV